MRRDRHLPQGSDFAGLHLEGGQTGMSVSISTSIQVDDAHPSITITNPTPPRPSSHTTTVSISPLNPTITGSPHRLLYRGALSLPDSHLLLDGLTFTSHSDRSKGNDSDKASRVSLLENPLALALESMRGRPTLRFMGVRPLHAEGREGGWADFSGGVCLYVPLHYGAAEYKLTTVICSSYGGR